MSDNRNEKAQCLAFRKKIHGNKIGEIICVDSQDKILVDYPGNPHGPIFARLTATAFKESCDGLVSAGQKVILMFENNDSDKPIVLDFLSENDVSVCRIPAYNPKTPKEVVVDGKRVVLEGDSEIVLRCGKCSITLTQAGKIVIKGKHVLSQAMHLNHIKGGSIELN